MRCVAEVREAENIVTVNDRCYKADISRKRRDVREVREDAYRTAASMWWEGFDCSWCYPEISRYLSVGLPGICPESYTRTQFVEYLHTVKDVVLSFGRSPRADFTAAICDLVLLTLK